MTLGEKIRACRQEAGMSQEKVAELVGVSRQAVTKWEADQSLPGIDNLQALAAELGVTVDQLLTGGPEAGEDPALDQPGTRPENAPPADPALSLAGVKALLDAAEQAAARRRRRTLLAVVAGILAAAQRTWSPVSATMPTDVNLFMSAVLICLWSTSQTVKSHAKATKGQN